MRVSVLLLESDVVLSEYVVVHPVQIDPVAHVLELVLHTVERVALLDEILDRGRPLGERLESP